MSKSTKVYPVPGVFIPGVPAVEQEFESKAAAEEFLAGETSGLRHDGSFSLDPPDPDLVAAYGPPAPESEPEPEAASPPAATEADTNSGSEE